MSGVADGSVESQSDDCASAASGTDDETFSPSRGLSNKVPGCSFLPTLTSPVSRVFQWRSQEIVLAEIGARRSLSDLQF